ncbi:hypothetical protein CTAYLR_009970 [Chrysophaeum taylorii]|uniref:Glycerol-3-phosphate dehydrogenase [NAD(+)] n=1 Tax=Chrysophaeum taylorii TaxID=2483200 RepID=A0AAD7U5X4_9STRA|nr:hypothetical protein CTAYLR_009970 [Chrysophaeum taylorii]
MVVVCVIGAGAFGTAMAWLASTNGHPTRVCARDKAQCEVINATQHNPKYLRSARLEVKATSDAKAALEGAEVVILCLPAQKCVAWIRENRDRVPSDAILCSTAKGLYLETKQLLSEAMAEAFGRPQRLAFLSGPSFAQYIVDGHPTAVVVASRLLADAVAVQRLLSNPRFRVYASQDTIGVELGGALKNVLALGAGMIAGANFGINTLAAYVTRAARELAVLCVAMGGKPETIAGLSGIGDLMLTTFGDLSRNRACGLRLARGERLDDILQSSTVEGVPTAQVAVEFARRCNLDLPLIAAVNDILQAKLTPRQALDAIMTRPLGTEVPLL